LQLISTERKSKGGPEGLYNQPGWGSEKGSRREPEQLKGRGVAGTRRKTLAVAWREMAGKSVKKRR